MTDRELKEEDFLNNDMPIPGQNFVCLSFISPEKIIKNKELYYMHNFVKSKFNYEGDIDSFDKVLNVNLRGTLLGMQSCVAKMLENETQGSIVTVASIAAKHPDAGPVSYTVSKAGVWMLTKKAARMLGPVGIRVNSIGPGFINTHMTAIIDLMDESETAAFNEMIPLGRRGEPIDIANAALFLCSDEASYFTGEILHPDGGFFTE